MVQTCGYRKFYRTGSRLYYGVTRYMAHGGRIAK